MAGLKIRLGFKQNTYKLKALKKLYLWILTEKILIQKYIDIVKRSAQSSTFSGKEIGLCCHSQTILLLAFVAYFII